MPEPLFGDEDRRIDAALDVESHNRKSGYNVPGYRPVRTELTHAPVRVTGTLPADLEGVYLRNDTNGPRGVSRRAELDARPKPVLVGEVGMR